MSVSSNSLAKKAFTESANTFADGPLTASANVMAKKSFPIAYNAWTGDNLTSDPLGFDYPGGAAFGSGELGGIAHFKNRTATTITH